MQTGLVDFADAAGAYHLCDASVSEDVACVDEAVQHLSCLLDQVTLVGIILQLLIWRQNVTENIVGVSISFDSLQRCKTENDFQKDREYQKYNEVFFFFF